MYMYLEILSKVTYYPMYRLTSLASICSRSFPSIVRGLVLLRSSAPVRLFLEHHVLHL